MLHQFWHLSEAGEDNLGPACTENGLLLGRTPLIERRGDRFVVRERAEIERLLGRAYGAGFPVDRLMAGLASVASALNTNDQCLARIAAIHLRLPDVASQAARSAMEAEDILIKSGTWKPDLHPRAGVPPNPGWFAPTDGSGDETSPVQSAQNDSSTGPSHAHAPVIPVADNRRENKQVRDVVVKLGLNADQAQALHREISGMGYGYHEILEIAKDMFGK